MLGGRDEHAFLHKAGGVADARHIPADRFDLETIEIGTPKNNARTGWGGQHAHGNRSAAVQANPIAFHRGANCLLVGQK